MTASKLPEGMKLVATGDQGLDLVLGGGLAMLERRGADGERRGPTTSVLVRGRPGAGKSALSAQLAVHAARALDGDVAYACVELLPEEFAAQRARLAPEGASERVVVAPFDDETGARRQGEVRFYAGILDLGETGREAAQLPRALPALVSATRAASDRVRVVVLDSVSAGYHLTTGIERPVVDAIVKWALSEGLVLIVVEESVSATPSSWSFSCDVVLELSLALDDQSEANESAGRARRQLLVRKNRFGPAAPGPHMVQIAPRKGCMLIPHLDTYQNSWVYDSLFPHPRHRPIAGSILNDLLKKEPVEPISLLLMSGSPVKAALWSRRLWRHPSGQPADVVAVGMERLLGKHPERVAHVQEHDSLTSPAETVLRVIEVLRSRPDQDTSPVLMVAVSPSWERGFEYGWGAMMRPLRAIARRASLPVILVGVSERQGILELVDGILAVTFAGNGTVDVRWLDRAANEEIEGNYSPAAF